MTRRDVPTVSTVPIGSKLNDIALFNGGVMKADLKMDDTIPTASDRLNSSTRNGAIMSTLSFSSLVGSGSDEHCLSGRARTATTTSTTDIGRKQRRTQSRARGSCKRRWRSITGGRTDAGHLRIKKRCKSSALMLVEVAVCPRPINATVAEKSSVQH